MMIQEIRISNLDDANIHSMIEFQLMRREKDLLIKTKDEVVHELGIPSRKNDVISEYMTSYVVRDISIKCFDKIINLI